jgi:2-dehydro-3-deoxyphosphogluconate aldolase / (4S)-4-hydroxy-2-oxoglutarate aldolase
MHAIRLGLTLLKFFPADAMGAPKTLNHISDAFPQVTLSPQGESGWRIWHSIYAAGGSWMATRHLIHEGRFDEIIRMAKATREIVKHIRDKIE